MCNCVGWATDSVDGTFVCEQCAPVLRIEAVTDRLAGLTSWSRAVVVHTCGRGSGCPPGSLEMHNVGLELVEDGMDEWFRLPRGRTGPDRDDERAMTTKGAAPGPWSIVDNAVR